MNVYVGGDGNIHFINRSGADTVLPFRKTPEIVVSSVGEAENTKQYTALRAGHVIVTMSTWGNNSPTFLVTKNGSSISEDISDNLPGRNRYIKTYIVPVKNGDTIIAKVYYAAVENAYAAFLSMFMI